MSRFCVLLTDYAWSNLDIETAILNRIDCEIRLPAATDPATLAAAAVGCDAIMTNWAKVPAAVIQAATGCKIVARLGIGLDNIDVAAATARGVMVTNVPDYCLIEVAEHALAQILALGRKIGWYHAATKAGKYELQAGPTLRRIEGQTLGIVGLGNIGRRLAEKAVALRMNVLATSRGRSQTVPGVQFVDLPELLAASDYISLHVPLTPQTKHLIGAAEFRQMKPSAYLINTARGGLIDAAALSVALKRGQLAGAALDVQDPEPPDLSQPPYTDPRVIVTPHAAFVSVESLVNLRSRTAQQVADALTGNLPENIVNPSVLQ